MCGQQRRQVWLPAAHTAVHVVALCVLAAAQLTCTHPSHHTADHVSSVVGFMVGRLEGALRELLEDDLTLYPPAKWKVSSGRCIATPLPVA